MTEHGDLHPGFPRPAHARPAPAVAAGAVLVLALLAAGPAEAQELSQLILERLTGFMVMSVVVIFVLQVVFVRVGVWLLRLEGGLLRAAGAVLLGGVLGAVLGFVGGIALAMTVPPALQGVAAGGIGFVAGGLGIKLLLRTDLIRGMIVHLAAATATLIVYSLLLIVVY